MSTYSWPSTAISSASVLSRSCGCKEQLRWCVDASCYILYFSGFSIVLSFKTIEAVQALIVFLGTKRKLLHELGFRLVNMDWSIRCLVCDLEIPVPSATLHEAPKVWHHRWYCDAIHQAVTNLCLWLGDVLPPSHISPSIVLLVVCKTTVTVDVRRNSV